MSDMNMKMDFEIADEGLVNITNNILSGKNSNSGGGGIGAIFSFGKQLAGLKSNLANSSITKMAKDYVMQFPMIASSAIPVEDRQAISKNFEISYAQFIAMILNGITGLSTKDMHTTADILKMLHNNKNVPNILNYASDAVDLFGAVANESIVPAKKHTIVFDRIDMESMAYGTHEEITLESLNNLYLPNTAIENKFAAVTSAMEAKKVKTSTELQDDLRSVQIKRATADYNNTYGHQDPHKINYMSYMSPQEKKQTADYKSRWGDKDPNDIKAGDFGATNAQDLKAQADVRKADAEYRAKYGNKKPSDIKAGDFGASTMQDRKSLLDMANNSQNTVNASDLNRIQNTGDAPTVLTATIYLETESGQPMEPRSLLFGVKMMTRAIPSEVMVANVSSCITTNNWAFKFMKWTRGETKFFRDIIFDITKSRELAKKDVDPTGVGKWFAAVERRKKNAHTFLGSRENLAPIMTIIITDAEADSIKAQTGIDLTQDSQAAKLMKDMYLLGFAIYNTATSSVSIMMDGYTDESFYNTTVSGLQASNKASSSVDLKEVNKLLQYGGYIR